MKKFKSKLGAFILATSLLGGALISCGKTGPTPIPTPVKCFVNPPADSRATVNGLNVAGYEPGEEVTFTVTVNTTEYELRGVTANGVAVEKVGEVYSFLMPTIDVDLAFDMRRIDVYALTIKGTLKVGFTVSTSLTLNSQQVLNYTLESEAGTGSVTCNGISITGVTEGTVTIIVKVNNVQVLRENHTVAPVEHGELITDPLTPKEAFDKGKALSGTKVKTELEYYVKGHVVAGLGKYQGTDEPLAKFFMEDNFQTYNIAYGEGEGADKLDYGTEVIVHGKIYKQSNTVIEMAPGASQIVQTNNETAWGVRTDEALVRLTPDDISEALNTRIAPTGSTSSEEIQFTNSNSSIATYDAATDKVTALQLGTTTLTFTAGDLKTREVKVYVAEEVNDGTEQHPLTGEEAWLMTKALDKDTMSNNKYWIKGVVDSVTEKVEKESGKQTEEAWGYATWKIKTATNSKFTIYSVDLSHTQYDALEVGAETIVKDAKLYNFNNTMETNGGSVVSVDNTKVTTLVLDKTQAIAVKGDELVLTPSLLPASAAATANLVWSSDNEDAVTVDAENGDITLVAAGVANVTVTDTVSGLSASCKVTVTNNPMVVRPIKSTEFAVGEEYYLGLVLGDDVVYANGEMDGYYLAGQTDVPEVKAKLVNAAEADGNYKYNLLLNDQYVLCYATPDDKNPEEWHTNIGLTSDATDERIALVQYDAQGRLSVKGWNKTATEGTEEHARVQMWIGNQKNKSYTSFSYRIESELNNAANFYILAEADALTGISLNQTTLNLNGLGVKAQLTASPNPSTAVIRNLKWRSENGAIATVTQQGEVETVAVGETKVVAYIEGSDPEIKAECTVKVTNDQLDSVEYVYTDFGAAGKQTVTHDPITVVISNGAKNDNNKDFRVYKDATITISSTHTITKIEMTSSGGSNGVDKFTAIDGWTVKDAKNGTWEGGSTSVSLTATVQVRLTKLVVYFVK